MDAFWLAKDTKFLHVDKEYRLACVDAQAGLSFRFTHISEGTFSLAEAQYNRKYTCMQNVPITI